MRKIAAAFLLVGSTSFGATGDVCDPRNAIQDYLASKVTNPVQAASQQAARTSQDLDQRLGSVGSSLAPQQKMAVQSVLKDAQEFTELAKATDPYRVAEGPASQATVDATRDSLNLLKKKAEILTNRLRFLSNNNPDLKPLLARSLRDLEKDRGNIDEALSLLQKKNGVDAATKLSQVRMLTKEGIAGHAVGALGELQIVARIGQNAQNLQRDVSVAGLLRAQKGIDVETAMKSMKPADLSKILDESYPIRQLPNAQKMSLIANKEIDMAYTEQTAGGGSREVWSEVKNSGHPIGISELTRRTPSTSSSGGTYDYCFFDQLSAMKAARDVVVQATGKPIQLELIVTNGLTQDAQTYIEQSFPGVFRFR